MQRSPIAGLPPVRRLGPRWSWLLATALLGAIALPLRAGFFQWFFRREVQVITTTDLTPEGNLLRVPSAADPVYYVGVNGGYHDFGGAIAGDKLPKSETMVLSIVRALARAGYLPADARHPPTQIIFFNWGTLYRVILSPDPDFPVQLNRSGMMRFLGGDKLGLVPKHPDPWGDDALPGLIHLDASADAVRSAASDDLYAVVLFGIECPIKDPKHPRLLWRSKIGCPARGLAMADTLPTMLFIAAPYLGHDTPRPVWINATDKFKPSIWIGPPKFEEFLGSGQLPVVDPTAQPADRGAKTQPRPAPGNAR